VPMHICRFCNSVCPDTGIDSNYTAATTCLICTALYKRATLRGILDKCLAMCSCCRTVSPIDRSNFELLLTVKGTSIHIGLSFSFVTVRLCTFCVNELRIADTIINRSASDVAAFREMILHSRKVARNRLREPLRAILPPGMNDPIYVIVEYLIL
jgi:hypothetical protein